MLTLAQRIDYAAAAIASMTGATSDQVVDRLLGNARRPDGSSITIPADDERAARKAAQYAVRRRERGQEERDA